MLRELLGGLREYVLAGFLAVGGLAGCASGSEIVRVAGGNPLHGQPYASEEVGIRSQINEDYSVRPFLDLVFFNPESFGRAFYPVGIGFDLERIVHASENSGILRAFIRAEHTFETNVYSLDPHLIDIDNYFTGVDSSQEIGAGLRYNPSPGTVIDSRCSVGNGLDWECGLSLTIEY